ncbi:MAG: hypothetical protein FWD74_09780 [Actinomycetia bacterium]|nr:hypothetical protein [Actinomycetes bacterium]
MRPPLTRKLAASLISVAIALGVLAACGPQSKGPQQTSNGAVADPRDQPAAYAALLDVMSAINAKNTLSAIPPSAESGVLYFNASGEVVSDGPIKVEVDSTLTLVCESDTVTGVSVQFRTTSSADASSLTFYRETGCVDGKIGTITIQGNAVSTEGSDPLLQKILRAMGK